VYRKAAVYPEERLLGCLYKIVDVKLQFYFLLEVDIALYNSQVFDLGFQRTDPASTPHLFLRHLSFDQTIIVKARILWERIMNFIYFFETGKDLETKVSGKKSKRSLFFSFVEANSKWRFLLPYVSELDSFDRKYRGPEVHKASTLRAHLILGKVPSGEDIVRPLNRAMNTIWPNVISIAGGQPASFFTDLHLSENGHTVDLKYAAPTSERES
jgi:hypothetical protein